MGRKLTVEEVQARLKDRGFELVNPAEYRNTHTKCDIKCHCGRVARQKCVSVLCDIIQSCGHCNDPEVGDRFGSLTIVEVKPGKTGGCTIVTKCDCGREYVPRHTTHVTDGSVKRCGHCNDPAIGDVFGSLTVMKVVNGVQKGQGCRVYCKCDCGKESGPYLPCWLQSGNVKSCGHCNDPCVGDRFGSLTVTNVIPNNGGGCSVMCECSCGATNIGLYQATRLRNGNIRSCGYCNVPNIGDRFGSLVIEMIFYGVGGKGSSVVCLCDCGEFTDIMIGGQLGRNNSSCGKCGRGRSVIVEHELLPLICEVLGKDKEDIIVEGRIPTWSKGVDLIVDNICIEFDGYHFHREIQDTTETEKRKAQAILDAGYKLLRIRSSGNKNHRYGLPSKAMLRCAFNALEEISMYEIMCHSWVEREYV